MGHHRRSRLSARSATGWSRGVNDGPAGSAPATNEAEQPLAHHAPRPVRGVGGRDLDDLAEAARTARRTGWPYGSEVLASGDTSRVPASPPDPSRPRRYATHQPTEPFHEICGL
jgi:hypothetical protein